MINPQWLEMPVSRTIFHGPEDVRAMEIRLFINILLLKCQELGVKRIHV